MSIAAAFRAELLEERPDCLPAAPAPDPQDLLDARIDNHHGVATALLDGELVRDDHLGAGQVDRPKCRFQIVFVDCEKAVASSTFPAKLVQLSKRSFE